jgi:glycerol-3-phosphate dehydrogenase
VLARFAGIRVLSAGAGDTERARRETAFSVGPIGMLSVAGGKLTTYRRIALAVLHALRPQLELHRIDRRPRPLPGAADPDVAAEALRRQHPELDAVIATHLARAYGGLAHEVVRAGPLTPLAGDVIEAEVLHSRDREWALDADDFLARRTTLALTGRDTPAVRSRVEELLAS